MRRLQAFTEKVIQIIQQIPPGKIMTYGQVAAAAGSPRAARQVTRILHSMSAQYNLPWHRIVNVRGQIVLKDEEARYFQKTSLQNEGVEVDLNDQIDLTQFQLQIQEKNHSELY